MNLISHVFFIYLIFFQYYLSEYNMQIYYTSRLEIDSNKNNWNFSMRKSPKAKQLMVFKFTKKV